MEGSTRWAGFAKLAQVLIQDSNSVGFASAMAGISKFEFGLSNSRSADGNLDGEQQLLFDTFSTSHQIKWLNFSGSVVTGVVAHEVCEKDCWGFN